LTPTVNKRTVKRPDPPVQFDGPGLASAPNARERRDDQEDFYQKSKTESDATVEIGTAARGWSRSAATGRTISRQVALPGAGGAVPRAARDNSVPFFAIVFVIINESHRAAGRGLTMPVGGIGLEDILLFTVAAGVIIVLGGGAFQAWRSWSDDRRIRKHLRN
jgi:hypothetical protein